MFANIKKKLIFFVTVSVGIMIIFTSLSLYSAFFKLITDSYASKIIQISKQEVQSSLASLNLIDSSIEAMIDELSLEDAVKSPYHNNHLIGNIKTYLSNQPYYYNFFIVINNKVMYYDGTLHSKITDYKKFTNDFKNRSRYYTIEKDEESALILYARNLSNDENNSAFAVVGISPDYLAADFSTEQTLANHKAVYLSAKNEKHINLLSDTIDNKEFEKIKKKGLSGLIVHTEEIIGTGLTAHIATENTYTHKYTFGVLSAFASICILVFILCFTTAKRLGSEISNQLDKIHNDIKNYIR